MHLLTNEKMQRWTTKCTRRTKKRVCSSLSSIFTFPDFSDLQQLTYTNGSPIP